MSTGRLRFSQFLSVLCLLFTVRAAVSHWLAAPGEFHLDRAGRGAPTPQPERSYVGRQGDAFVYEKPSVDGAGTEAPVLVWYVGVSKNNEPVVRYQDEPSTGTLSCYDDCQFVMGITQTGGRITQTGRIRVSNDPLIDAIMRDARSGALSQP